MVRRLSIEDVLPSIKLSTNRLALFVCCLLTDTWKQATSQDHFEKLIHVDRKLGSYTFRQLCVRTLRLCKNLPYSPVNWLYLILLGVICALYG